MPKIGETARARDVGAGSTSHKVRWLACEACGAERWVWLRRGLPQSRWCYPCGRREGKPRGLPRGPGHWHWKGGRSVTKGGYVEVWVDESSPFSAMRNKDGYVYEHRLVMAQHLGRPLTSQEVVHHRNRDKQDNRVSNLEVSTRSEHTAHHMRRLAELEAEVERLRGLLGEQAPAP